MGLADGRRSGQVDWLVRLRCSPDAAPAIASALSRRDDTSWVAVASGGTEITCLARARETGGSLLLEKISRTPRIHTVTAQCLLRGVAGTAGWRGRTSALTPAEAERIRAPRAPSGAPLPSGAAPPAASPGPVELGRADWSLLRALAADGRTGYVELASATGWSQSTVRRRLSQLHRDGVLYFDVDIDPALLGYTCQATLWLTVAPAQLTPVTRALAGHEEIAYAAATSGTTNVAAFAVCRDLDALYDYLADGIGSLRGVLQVESSPVIRQVKRAGAALAPLRTGSPERTGASA
ncbi:Lrp/AsnC family transcriptional regulator [Streptomyces sp. HNM0575]|uniref:Lrp/AsnC family transcriptional regulator n=1 Tax=Streptomyces sp. HNM0575 TaxID=2716338 RepID=UPI0032170373